MDDKLASTLAGYLKRYHTNSLRARQHGLAEGGVYSTLINELDNFQKRMPGGFNDMESVVQAAGFHSVIQNNRRRLQEIKAKAQESGDATQYIDEINELVRQIEAANHLMDMLNA